MHAGLIEMAVTVPVESEARARELLADLEYVGAAEAVGPRTRRRDSDDAGAAPAARRRAGGALARAGFTLFLPGTVPPLRAAGPGRRWCWRSSAVVVRRGRDRCGQRQRCASIWRVATICMIVLCDIVQRCARLGARRSAACSASLSAARCSPGIGLAAIAVAAGAGRRPRPSPRRACGARTF